MFGFSPGVVSTPPLPPLPKVHNCRREATCNASFTTAFARNRHEKSAHPTPDDVRLCATCNTEIAQNLFKPHVLECVRGSKKETRPASPSPTSSLRPPLDNSTIDAVLEPLLEWLSRPPSTLYSEKVKRNLLTPASTARVRGDYRNLCRTAYEVGPTDLFSNGLFLGGLIARPMVDAIQLFQQKSRQRGEGAEGVGNDTRYKTNLMLVKVIVYLAEASPVPLTPTDFDSWLQVQTAAHHASKQRRLDLRTKKLLNRDEPPPTTDELIQLTRFATEKMDEIRSTTPPNKLMYTNCLILASLVLLSVPRQQVFRQMTTTTIVPPQTVTNSTDYYEVRIVGDHLKNQRPELISITGTLTPYYQYYFSHILPVEHSGPIWLNERGKPRIDFGPPIRQLVHAIISKRCGPHGLRAAIATHWSKSSMSEAQRRGLGLVMDHSMAVHDKQYVGQRGRIEVQHELAAQWMATVNEKDM